MKSLDLNVDSPDKVAAVLSNAVEAYFASAAELSSAWQDPEAGKPWAKIAKILSKAMVQVDNVIGTGR